jgi:hypothetical protein
MSIRRWRGLKDLLQSAVENGSLAIERVQKSTAERPFKILEAIPPLTIPVRGIHEIYDSAVANTHQMIRLTTRVVGQTLDMALDAVDPPSEPSKPGPSEPTHEP